MHGSSAARGGREKLLAILAFTRLLVAVIGRPTARRALPVYAGLAMIYAVMFGPAGMRAQTVVEACRDSAYVRLGLHMGWLVLVLPPCASLFRSRESDYLRSLPAPAMLWWAVLVVLSLLLQLPWAVLWFAGGTPVEAVGAVTIVAAAAALLSTYPGRWGERLTGWIVLGGLLYFVIEQPIELWLIASVPCFLLATLVSWNRAPDHAGPSDPLSVRGGAGLALALTNLAALWRTNRSSVGRALVVAGLGAFFTGLTVRANALVGVRDIAGFSMAIAAVSLGIASGVLAAPLQEAERNMRWLLDTTATGAATRVLATSGVLALVMVVIGALHGGLAAWAAGASGLVIAQVSLLLAGWALGFGLLAARAARVAEASDGVDGTRLVSLVALLVLGAVVLLAFLSARAVVPWSIGGVTVAFASIGSRLAPRARTPRRRTW